VYVSEEDNNRVQKLGVPGRAEPRCPPVVTARLRAARGAVLATVRCDRACAARVRVTVRGAPRIPSARVDVFPDRASRVRVDAPRSLAGAVATVRVTARGFAGGSRPVQRRMRLR
jgi:hypothetical protein